MSAVSLVLRGVALAAALTLPVAGAQAGAATANVTIDLATAITGSMWTGYAHALDQNVSVHTGDTVTVNIAFAGTQQLTWGGDGSFNPWLMLVGFPGNTPAGQEGSFHWSNLNVTFTGLAQGTQLDPLQFGDGDSCCIHLGPSNGLGYDGVERTFTGVTLSFVADWTEGAPNRTYASIGYYGWSPLFEGTVSYSEPQPIAVAEPHSLALLGSGLLMVGMLRRRVRFR